MARPSASAGRGGRGRSPVPPPSGQSTRSPRKFVQEAWGELRKVQWPTGSHVMQGTLVVAFVTAVFAVYLTVVDQVIVRVMSLLSKNF